MNIAYFHIEGVDKKYPEAWNRIDELNKSGYGISKELTTIKDDFSYCDAIMKYWGHDDLILIEQDNLVTKEQLDSLINCPEPACAYWFYNSDKWLPGTLSIGCRIADPDKNFMINSDQIPLLEDGTVRYATFSGTGLTKISKRLQRLPLERFSQKTIANGFTGKNTDNALVENINLGLDGCWVRFHLHGEVEHSHNAGRQ